MENLEKVKNNIIDWIALGSGGRLVAFKPEQSPYLIVEKKGDYNGRKIVLLVEEKGNGIEAGKIMQEENFYVLFCVFDQVRQRTEEKVWLVPGTKLPKGTNEMDFSKNMISKGQFLDFLIESLVVQKNKK